MPSQLIFLDTEFTSFHAPELISIGLAASTGEEFYAEVPFMWSSCSPFVHDVVIPLLDTDASQQCVAGLLYKLIADWLAIVRIDSEVTICFDSSYDEELFRAIFDGFPPRFVNFRNIDGCINELLRHEFHVKNRLPEHHALNDARAMRYAFRERVVG